MCVLNIHLSESQAASGEQISSKAGENSWRQHHLIPRWGRSRKGMDRATRWFHRGGCESDQERKISLNVPHKFTEHPTIITNVGHILGTQTWSWLMYALALPCEKNGVTLRMWQRLCYPWLPSSSSSSSSTYINLLPTDGTDVALFRSWSPKRQQKGREQESQPAQPCSHCTTPRKGFSFLSSSSWAPMIGTGSQHLRPPA